MKRFFRKLDYVLCLMGINLPKFTYSMWRLIGYYNDYIKIRKQQNNSTNSFRLRLSSPCVNDMFSESGSIHDHYFQQDLYVAQKIFQHNPRHHVDVGSRIDGFVAHVASFRPIEVIDIRPLSSPIINVTFKQADMMAPLPGDMYDYCDSLSSLHAIEHFGLGRYGDSINYDGFVSGLDNLYLMLKKGGKLYFSVPIGLQRIEFNAHRVFSVRYLLDFFANKYTIDKFSYIDDSYNLHIDVSLADHQACRDNFGCGYGCGIFEMSKI